MRRLTIIALLLIGSLAAMILVLKWPDIRIYYHRKSMLAAKERIYSKHPTSISSEGLIGHAVNQDAVKEYEFHRGRLVALGELVHRRYVFRYIKDPTEESKHLTKRILRKECPACFDFTSPWRPDPFPMEIEIWGTPEQAKEWDAFVERYDVPDYREQFMAGMSR